MLIDHANIIVESGKGGDGCVAFRREKYIPKGGPSGGDGGKGGSVYLHAQAGFDTLLDYQGRHKWKAQSGEQGRAKQQTGADGEDLIIKLPPGTLVYDAETDELIVDLDEPGKTYLIAEGGKPGWGNDRFASSTNQVPTQFTPGGPAVRRSLRLELKLIADVGLVGKPNAGKSTLLSRVSKAHPKIADYPFTTLEPELGIAELPGYRRIVIADLPGLIEGAHEGTGLGHSFLRHIERTRMLVHLLEIDPLDGSDPVDNFRTINRELAEYSEILAHKPQVVVVSKLDLVPDAETQQLMLSEIEKGIGQRPLVISSASGKGLPELLEVCWKQLVTIKEQEAKEKAQEAAKAAAEQAE